ncbi:Outward-rectifier potassium channel [Lachnellula occidentalis]|uniref:Outward-rectifier potassium channel n=1 Tax=Lachnellula occidentalis TaxID=215460 RepID=A0A8H8S4Y3_9HELO|nr:Outward-rectifier potassium channel [Lachnellula occidentalis]
MADDSGVATERSNDNALTINFTDDINRSTSSANTLEKEDTVTRFGKLRLRGKTDDLPQDWWFASTAIPLVAATLGPLANVLSIAALVSKWRVALPNNGQLPEGTDDAGIDIPDPHWEIVLNAISLALGFFGNFCLLLNFTRRVRYIIALPATIISWYIATGILIGIIVAMNNYVPPVRPGETYSQGFWHAIIAASLYLIGSMMLMVNMLGYFLGHYPQHFDLDDDQRTLILQTMMFFFWLAGGAAVFSKVCGWDYADALYFCDVTVLTVGFGDFVGDNDAGRGLVFPYSVGGIIFLGLMINSIRKFALGMSKDKVVKKHQLKERQKTYGRSVTSEKELRERLGLPPRRDPVLGVGRPSFAPTRRSSSVASLKNRRESLEEYGHFDINGRTITFHEKKKPAGGGGRGGAGRRYNPKLALSRDAKMQQRAAVRDPQSRRAYKREKLVMLKEEKDRFDAMRDIQARTRKFEQYFALSMSALAFSILWCVGAAVFMVAEHRIQDMSYFEALYFCYVSLLTIGYGDFSPKSNAGKPFFVIWSLIAIPTMTILISDMSDTVVSGINRGTFTLADWTVMPKEGIWRDFLESHPKLRLWLEQKTKEREAKKRVEHGFELQNPDEESTLEGNGHDNNLRTLEKLAEERPETTEHELARKLALAIKRTANDLRSDHEKKYTYEEWVEFTRLIKFSSMSPQEVEREEEEEGLVEWDWIGEDSPMLADVTESEWVLDRLCESLNRYTRKQAAKAKRLTLPVENESLHRHHGHGDEKHRDHPEYPAHPGRRHPNTNSPVLSRGPSGDVEVLPLNKARKRNRDKDKEPERDIDVVRQLPSTSGSGSGESSGTAVNDGDEIIRLEEVEKEIHQDLEIEAQGRESRDWAFSPEIGKDRGM